MYLLNQISLPSFLLLLALWGVGGRGLVARLFVLRPGERSLVGFALGLALSNWLTNILAHFLPFELSFWLAAVLIGLLGGFLWWRERPVWRGWGALGMQTWLGLAALTLLLAMLGRGLALFDDYQNLPMVSVMATGDIPPHFPLNPDLRFGYHYFLLLVAAQFVHAAQVAPWVAVDLARALTLALTLMLAGLLAYRYTRNRVAQMLAVGLVAFDSGARWLLFLLPRRIFQQISDNVTLIGSSGERQRPLIEMMDGFWRISDTGVLGLPYAFVNGVNTPFTMLHYGMGTMPALLVLLFLFTGGRVKTQWAWAVRAILLASLALANELTFSLLALGALFGVLVWLARYRRAPLRLWGWVGAAALASVLAFVQGGMFTEVLAGWLTPAAARDTYFSVIFRPVFPPVLVSAHLGLLSWGNIWQAIAALFELGAISLLVPLVLLFGWRSALRARWHQAGLAGMTLSSMLMMFLIYDGNAGISASMRLLEGILLPAKLLAVPLLWMWLKPRADFWRGVVATWGIVAVLSGVVLFALQIPGAARPIHSDFLDSSDAFVFSQYWNKLERDARIFDPVPPRATTVFGRFTKSAQTWYEELPDFEELRNKPNLHVLRAAGFDYVYHDYLYWLLHANMLDDQCGQVIFQTDDLGEDGEIRDFRRLLDIRACIGQ
jgi:hypothetical protein